MARCCSIPLMCVTTTADAPNIKTIAAQAAPADREVLDTLTLLLSAVRPSPPRSGERRDLVFRLRRQHARQRLSGPTRHPAARALFGPHQGLSTALQSGRPAQGQGCTSELCPDPRAKVWGVLHRITRRGLLR